MLDNLALAAILMVVTTAIHASGMAITLRLVKLQKKRRFLREHHLSWYKISQVVLLMFLVAVCESLLWALTYVILGVISTFEQALYFSMVTFTTLGYGDILITGDWRLLASFQAAVGIIMFGWTTAIVIFAVQQIFFPKDHPSPL